MTNRACRSSTLGTGRPFLRVVVWSILTVVLAGGMASALSPSPGLPGVHGPLGSGLRLAGSGLNVTMAAGPTSGPLPLHVFFNETVSGGTSPYTYSWQFGDGGNGTGRWISHTYTTKGTYIASLRVQDTTNLTGTAETTIDVGAPQNNSSVPLTVQLTAAPSRGNAPMNSSMTATASGGTTPYALVLCPGYGGCFPPLENWSGAALNYTVPYARPGNFSAVATVTDALGNQSIATVAISVGNGSPFVVIVAASATTGPAPLAVGFSVTVTGGTAPYTIQWAWGDGTFGSSTDGGVVAHAYLNPGVYAATVTVRDSLNHTRTIAAGPVDVTSASKSSPLVLLPNPSAGFPDLTYLIVVVIVGLLSAVGFGLLLRRVWRRRDAAKLARSLEREAGAGR